MSNIFLITLIFLISCSPEPLENRSKVADFEVSYQRIQDALKLYKFDCGSYPSDLGQLNMSVNCIKWKERDVPNVSLIDNWGRKYEYLYPTRKNDFPYELFSYGEDGIEGTEDDIANWLDYSEWRKYYTGEYTQ